MADLRALLGDRYGAAIKAASNAMSRHWRDMHTNEALGLQRMLAAHALAAVLPDLLADVWDECSTAWQAYLDGRTDNVPPLNPYRTEGETHE